MYVYCFQTLEEHVKLQYELKKQMFNMKALNEIVMVHSVRKPSVFSGPSVFGLFPKVRRASQQCNTGLANRAMPS